MTEEPNESQPGAPAWIVTFADLMSLLMTFFVLLLSFSNMEIIKFRTMAGSVRNALGLRSEFDLSDLPMGDKLLPFEDAREGDGEGPGQKTDAIRAELERMLREAGLPGRAEVEVTARGVTLRVHGDLLFDSGEAELMPRAFPILDRLASYIAGATHYVDVQGHTDVVPIATLPFPSNWELSAARAARAVRYLVEQGVPPERLRAIGLADTQPVASNESGEGRAFNRRIEFLFVAAASAEGNAPQRSLENFKRGE